MKGLALPLLLLLAAPTVALAQGDRLLNADVDTENVRSGGLASAVKGRAAAGSRFVAWEVLSLDPEERSCCYGSLRGKREEDFLRGGCKLEGDRSFVMAGETRTRLGGDRLHVFLRLERGQVDRVRVYSAECPLDAEGKRVSWLTGVAQEESVAFLSGLVEASPETEVAEHALMALAAHRGEAADRMLEAFVQPGRPLELRKKASFWLGNSRGLPGFEALRRVLLKEPGAAFRREATFALSQSRVPEAVPLLISMARRDPSGEVRGQALFWLAQVAGERAAGSIGDAVDHDPDTEVKVQAVFALTQLPHDEGIPHLIRLARTHRNGEVRRQAVFWLGQSKDPRSLTFLEELVAR